MATAISPFSSAHRFYVKSLYKRYLVNALDWTVRRDIWRQQAIEIRAEFERNRNVYDPRALAVILSEAEIRLAERVHPDPYIVPSFPGGTKWERNLPPPIGPIYDHHREQRDAKIQALINELEESGMDARTSMEAFRKESDIIDSYLRDQAADGSHAASPASH